MSPKVTVLMPVYNGDQYLKEAIDSILGQTFKDFEFLIINDGSTDKSIEIIESYNDKRIKLIHNEKNMGLIYTLNKGLELAKGKYIARMDADDISLPPRLQKQVDFMDKNKDVGVCGTWIKTFGDNIISRKNKVPSDNEEIGIALLFNCVIMHPTVIMRKSLLDKYNLRYDEKHKDAEDYGLWVRCIHNFKLANIPEVLLNYRVLNTSITAKAEKDVEKRDRIHKLIYKEALSYVGINPTNSELNFHRNLNKSVIKTDDDFFEMLNSWFKKIYYSNKVEKKFEQTKLEWFLCDYYRSIVIRSDSFGFSEFRKNWKEKFSSYLSMTLIQKAKFELKGFLKFIGI